MAWIKPPALGKSDFIIGSFVPLNLLIMFYLMFILLTFTYLFYFTIYYENSGFNRILN